MSSKKLNIGGDKHDINYRYKMPPLQTKIEGRGNGIKTVLLNVSDVCRHLHIEPQYVTKFFGIQHGALSHYEDSRNVGIVNGVHTSKQLQTSLERFIRDFILCPKCRLPELQKKVNTKKGMLLQRCASCGWKGPNSSTHKVKTYIINHPPPEKKKSKILKIKGKSKSTLKNAKKTSSTRPTVKSKSKSKSAKAKIKRNDQTNDSENKEEDLINKLGGADDSHWSVDVSEIAVIERRKREMETVRNRVRDEENKNSVKEDLKTYSRSPDVEDKNSPSAILRDFILGEKRSVFEVVNEIKRIALARNFDEQKKIQIMFDAVCNFKSLQSFCRSLQTNKELLKFYCTDLSSINNCKLFFACLEEIIARRNPGAFLKKSYVILQTLYDQDIVDELQILDWYATPNDQAIIVEKEDAAQIRAKALPFITWLQTAQSDSEESGDSD